MKKFYTNVMQVGNKIFVREVNNGKKDTYKVEFRPTLFTKSRTESKYKSLFGDNLEPIQFLDINDAKDFIKKYKEVDNFPIFGNTSFAYQFITEHYPNEVDYDISQLTTFTIDIETASENGFPSVDNPIEEVLLITLQDNVTKKITTFGAKKFDINNIKHITNKEKFEYVKCRDEADLLSTFLRFWQQQQPDVVTGWNTQIFDLPYLMVRIKRILGEDRVKDLSPWRIVNEKTITMNGREHLTADIYGVSNLDYYDLYRKFTYSTQESYKLDYIAQQELGRKKLETGYETFKEHYTEDWQSFVEYNVIDVELVDALEDKMKLIELVITMAYDAKCNFTDIFSAVRTWDCILYNHLWNQNLIVQQKETHEGRTIAGAYVKEPTPGKYDWVVSFDAASLYPSIIMSLNISPETKIGRLESYPSVDSIIAKRVDIQNDGYAHAANGVVFRKEKQGFLPALMEKMYDDRVTYKKMMIEAKKRYEETKNKEDEKLIARYHNLQLAKKIQLNSAYGALGNQYFRWFNFNHAEAITTSGQLSIRWIERKMNEFMNKLLKTTDKDYVIASDTDSIYVEMIDVVHAVFGGEDGGPDDKVIVDALDKFIEAKIQPYMDKCYQELADMMNAYQQKMQMKRETIANKGIWKAKKMYILNAWNIEGVQYDKPKLKIQGIEAVRSSTPYACRENIKKALEIVMNGDEDELQKFISDFRSDFINLPFEQVAFPRGVKGLEKYTDKKLIYKSATPIQVKAALLYNNIILNDPNMSKYPAIQDGDKIRFAYLKEPNPIHESVIACLDELPKEFGLDKYIDHEKQFDKAFLEPLKSITEVIDWQTEKISSLEEFFA